MVSIASEIAVESGAEVDSGWRHAERVVQPADRQLAGWVQLAALAGFAALAAPFFLGRIYVADDLGEFHLPVRSFFSEQLARGEPFDWMDSLFGGFYLTGEGQLGGYHPLHQALYRLLPLGAAFDLELLVSYPLMFAGTFLFLRRWLRRADAALFGAMAFTFCGFNLLHFVHPNAIAIVAHVPWLLFVVEVAIVQSSSKRRAAAEFGAGLLTASELLVGYPQYAWFSLMTIMVYLAWRAIAVRAVPARVAMILLAMGLGAVSASIQLLPTFDALADSVRSQPNGEFANTGSLHPLNVVQLVAPYLFATRVVGQNTHELGFYAGAVPCLLSVWLLGQRRRWGHLAPLVWASLVFGGAALLLAMGRFGGLHGLQTLLPLVNRFRFPCRTIVLAHLCIAVLAAVAMSILLRCRHGRRHVGPSKPLIGVVLASVMMAVAAPILWSDFVAQWTLVWCGPPLFIVAATFIFMAERGARWAFPALAVLTVLDLGCYGLSYSVYGRTADLCEYVDAIQRPPGASDVRVAVEEQGETRVGDRMLLAGLKRIDGYAGLEPARNLDYATRSARQVAGVTWVYRPSRESNETENPWTRVDPIAPRARLVTRSFSSADVSGVPPTLDHVITEEALQLQGGVEGVADVILDRPGQMMIDTTAKTRQLLVTTESFHPGWQVEVDAQVQPALRVNRDFLGCIVEPGHRRVRFVFRPQSLCTGKILSGCGLGLLVCMFLARLGTGRRAMTAEGSVFTSR